MGDMERWDKTENEVVWRIGRLGRTREDGNRTYCERTRCVSGHCPSPAAVECTTLVSDDTEDTSSFERFWVDLHLDFENV